MYVLLVWLVLHAWVLCSCCVLLRAPGNAAMQGMHVRSSC